MKLWETWKFNGTEFIAFPHGNNNQEVIIYDEHGKNYGSFYDVESFRKRQKDGNSWGALGKIQMLRVSHI